MTFGDIVSTKKSEGSDLVPIFNIQHQMNEMFDRFFTGWDVCPSFSTVSSFPFLNVSETDKEVSIKAELPGMEEGDVRIGVCQQSCRLFFLSSSLKLSYFFIPSWFVFSIGIQANAFRQ